MRIVLILVSAVVMAASARCAATLWVDLANTSGIEDGTVDHPYTTIQAAIDAASNGDLVRVGPGEYVETITFEGSGITSDFSLLGFAWPPRTGRDWTVINGDLDGDPDTPHGPVVTFSGDEDETCVLAGFSITGGYNSRDGGGICGNETRAHIDYCVISDNRAEQVGGGAWACIGPITDSIIWGNRAEWGGGLCGCSGGISGNEIFHNRAYWEGGALYDCDGLISGNVIASNTAHRRGGGLAYCDGEITGNAVTGNNVDECGGGLAFCNAAITDNVIAENTGGIGGGLYWCEAAITLNTIMNNSALYNGGGLHECHGLISDNIVTDNEAEEGGGMSYCSPEITRNIIMGNHAAGYGGGMALCDSVITDNEIRGNTAVGGGGGMYYCVGTMANNVIAENTSEGCGGGAFYCGGEMRDNTVVGNEGDCGGGVGYFHGRVVSNEVRGNCAEYGGGLWCCSDIVACNVIVGNAATYGGGLDFCWAVVNNIVVGNAAQWGGGVSQGWDVANNTIVGNCATVQGGGLYHIDEHHFVEDCIVWGNYAPEGPQVYDCPAPSYSCIEGWSGGGVGNIADDPLFVANGYWTGAPGESEWIDGDYRLRQLASGYCVQSPCVDSGDPAGEPYGSTRSDRVADAGRLDMGYHYPGHDSSTTPEYLMRKGWNLVSLPLVPDCNAPEVALPGSVGPSSIGDSVVARYVPGFGYEDYPRFFRTVGLGKGYWMRLGFDSQNTTTGVEVEGEVPIPLSAGWNLIGCPKNHPVHLASCQLDDGGGRLPFEGAVAAGWLQGSFFTYIGEAYHWVRPDGAGDDAFLRPWQGYWVLAYRDGLKLVVE